MFFPLRDQNPTRRFPAVTYGLIALNVAVFVYAGVVEAAGEKWTTAAYGLIPRRFVADPLGEMPVVVSAMFLHSGWGHLIGNMVFLNLFGDNLEDALGRLRYVGYYLLCGLCATLLHVAVEPYSPIPMVGASGAIAGLVGGYLLLYPRAPVLSVTTMPLLWFFLPIFPVIPAWWVAAEFFVVNSYAALVAWSSSIAGAGVNRSGGVAVFAHLGGFAAGVILIWRNRQAHRQGALLWKGFRRTASESTDPSQTRWKRTRRLGE